MSYAPKTPSRRLRSDSRTPLTPSITTGLSNINLNLAAIPSPGRAKRGKGTTKTLFSDTPNPFLASPEKSSWPNTFSKSLSKATNYDLVKSLNGLNLSGNGPSRPSSPKKKLSQSGIIVTEELAREANGGVIKRGKGIESQFDILRNDYTPPPRVEMKRSRSQPAVNRRDRMYPREQEAVLDPTDRFITNPAERDLCATLEMMHLSVQSASPGHIARLAEATGVPVNKRVLAYHEAPPNSKSDPLLAEQRDIVRPLYARSGSASSTSTGSSSSKTRKLPTQPERVLDAPGMVDDFYLNLISWSSLNVVAVALSESTYTWSAETGTVQHLGEAPEGTYVSAVDFSVDGSYLAVGMGSGAVELWDMETNSKLRTMGGHQAQIPSLSWNGHTLASGCGDGSIWLHDVRVARHKVMELLGHAGEVCGLKWRPDGEFLASGANDNVINVWDGRMVDEILPNMMEPIVKNSSKWTKRNHTAAVKAIAWCPWQPSLLATGGGTNDATIHIWNTTTGARLHSVKTPAQITSLQFAPHKKEILSTHGYPHNAILVHSYPSLDRVAEIKDAHESRVLFSCVGPAGDLVLTGAGDENLKFWRIWEVPKVGKKKTRSGSTSQVREGIMTIR